MRTISVLIILFFGLSINAQTRQYIHNEYFHAVSVGKVEAASSVVKFGFNLDIDTGEEDLWANGGSITYLTSAEPILFASTSIADDQGSTGALTMRVIGLDGDYNEIEENITLDGQSNVESSDTFLRITRMYILTAGTGLTNAGTITATAKSASTVQASIPIGYGQTQQCFTTIPAGKTGYLIGTAFSCLKTGAGTSPKIQFIGNLRTFGGAWRRVYQDEVDVATDSNIRTKELLQIELPSKSDVRFSAITNLDNTVASGRVYIVLYDN